MTDAPGGGMLRHSLHRLVLIVSFALLGLIVAQVTQATSGIRVNGIADSVGYGKLITTLLAIGLFASVYGISRSQLRSNARVVLVAITFGVVGKALLTGGIMVLVFGAAGNLLLGTAVAQIDPLSVTTTMRNSGMSQRAKAILLAWASFDDPVTVLLVAYLAPVTLHGVSSRGALAIAGAGSAVEQIALNAALVALGGIAWYLLGVRYKERLGPDLGLALCCLTLIVLLALAVSLGLLVGIALCGLFFRPPLEKIITGIVDVAFYGAAFLLGMLLTRGANVLPGLVLGATVFAVQGLAGTIIGRDLPRDDRVRLALGQQNGLTAIVLALALAPYLPSAVGIVAVAILVVYGLHICSNQYWEASARKSAQIANFKQRLRDNPGHPQAARTTTVDSHA
jgi:hypothetical protein